ncbi:MAG: hypothetical protein SLAVMIC_00225 [uncultured marine phage]|uniref:Uncharacterized protein n=1 Tax=uncultured marine phage TaxID=707152 RepID=A0A8D9FRY9_9VIRU|nr:MAG: hypothetical protein SLAVMIC_00225 [uncultured marine phage]
MAKKKKEIPKKIYMVKSHTGRFSRPYHQLYLAKRKLVHEGDELITYNFDNSSNLAEMKREKRLSTLLDVDGDGFPSKQDNEIINLIKRLVPNLYQLDARLNRMTERKELKNFVVNTKYDLIRKIDSVEDFETLLKFHNFAYVKSNTDLFLEAKQNIKQK